MDGGQHRAGSRFGPYELRELIGRGGMGEVYRAYDTRKDREVALKLLPPGLAADRQYRSRFQREAQVAARLQEPHVIPIHDYGEHDGVLFIDMRLVEGKDLRAVLRTRSLLRPEVVVHIVAQVAEALDAAHRDGLVHRDVKPENVLMLHSGFVYLADFGIAARTDDAGITSAGEALGSFSYMAPERFDERPTGPAVDIYALGCLTYELFTGRPPFRRSTVSALIQAHLNDRPEPVGHLRPQLPAALDAVLARALSKEPAHRQGSATEFARQVQQALRGRAPAASTAVRPVAPHRSTHRPPRRPVLVGAVSAIVLVVLGLLGLAVVQNWFGSGDPAARSSPIGDPTLSTGAAPPSSATYGRASWPAILGDASAGYDWQGWSAYSAVRCHADDRAVAVASTSSSFVTVCQAHSGATYYLGQRPGQTTRPNSIELPDARRTGTGWTATNTKASVDYTVDANTLVVRDRARGSSSRESVTRFVQLPG